jgi:tellurite resistance protein TerC
MAEFSLILYVFGIFLLLTGVGMLFSKIDANPDLSENLLVKFLRKHMRVTDRLHEGHFFVRQADASGKSVVWATPLFLALVLVFIGGKIFMVGIIGKIPAVLDDVLWGFLQLGHSRSLSVFGRHRQRPSSWRDYLILLLNAG